MAPEQPDASLPEGERKTVTALFADIKGSMELMEDLDPEEARAIVDPALKLMIDAVHRYDGYIVQSTGDGIFALFGAPVGQVHAKQNRRRVNFVECGEGREQRLSYIPASSFLTADNNLHRHWVGTVPCPRRSTILLLVFRRSNTPLGALTESRYAHTIGRPKFSMPKCALRRWPLNYDGITPAHACRGFFKPPPGLLSRKPKPRS